MGFRHHGKPPITIQGLQVHAAYNRSKGKAGSTITTTKLVRYSWTVYCSTHEGHHSTEGSDHLLVTMAELQKENKVHTGSGVSVVHIDKEIMLAKHQSFCLMGWCPADVWRLEPAIHI